jgi:hypothetical protein
VPRFTSAVSNVSVSVSDETAERLGSEWVAVEAPKPASRPKKSDDKS